MARSNTGATANWLSSAATGFTNTSAYSVSLWFNPANLTASSNLFALASSASLYQVIVFDGANSYALGDNKLVVDISTSTLGTTTTVASASTWNHAALVGTSISTRSIFLNGGGKSTTTTDNAGAATYTLTQVGVFRPSTTSFSPLNGSVAEVGVWNVALSDAEVASLADGLSPLLVRPNNLIRYWPIYGVTSPERCLVSTNTLTINGTMAKAAHLNRAFYAPQAPIIGLPTVGGTSYTLTGGLTAAAFPITGATMVPRTAKTIAVAPSALPIAGVTVTPRYGRAVTITPATMPVSGQALATKVARSITVSAAALPIVGQAKATRLGRSITITGASLPIAGATVIPVRAKHIAITSAALPIVGQSIALLTARQITVTAAALPISGQSLTTVFSAGGINYGTTITAATLPVLGATVTPSTARQIAVAAAALPIVGDSIVPVFAPGSLAYGITITPATLAIVGGSLATDFSGAVEVFARRSLVGTFQPVATLSGVFDPTAEVSGIITPPSAT